MKLFHVLLSTSEILFRKEYCDISLEKFQIQARARKAKDNPFIVTYYNTSNVPILNPYEVCTIYLKQSSYAKGFPRKIPRRSSRPDHVVHPQTFDVIQKFTQQFSY